MTAAEPSAWLRRFGAAAPVAGPALDLACGGGRQGRLPLAQGRQVLFCDRDLSGVDDLQGAPRAWLVRADLERADLERAGLEGAGAEAAGDGDGWPFAARAFGLVIVANYLWRPLLPRIFAAVAPGGLLLYETFMAGQERFGRPRNPDFLLRPGELRTACPSGFEILAFEEGEVAAPLPAMRQSLAARRPV